MNAMNEEDEIDLLELLMVIRAKLLIILLASALCGSMAFLYTKKCVTPMYQASVRMIVNSKIDPYTPLTATDVTGAEKLVDTVSAVIKSNRMLNRVIENSGIEMDWIHLNPMVAVKQIQNTPVIDIVVTDRDPNRALTIVSAISDVAPEMIVDAVEAGTCKIIGDAYTTGQPIASGKKKYIMLGFLAGGALCAMFFLGLHLMNDRIMSEEELSEFTGVPVLSSIPIEGVKVISVRSARRSKNEAKARA